MQEKEYYIELHPEQRQAIEQSLAEPWLKGEMPVIEKIIAGKASPLEIVELVRMAYRVGHLKGMTAIVDLHNRIAISWEEY